MALLSSPCKEASPNQTNYKTQLTDVSKPDVKCNISNKRLICKGLSLVILLNAKENFELIFAYFTKYNFDLRNLSLNSIVGFLLKLL